MIRREPSPLTYHEMELPRKVVVGSGIINEIGDVCKSLGLSSSALMLTGPNTLELTGRKIEEHLRDSGINARTLIIKEPSAEYVRTASKAIKESRCSFVVGVGGGKVIDVAKLSSAFNKIRFISVPTVASHDGIASDHASIMDFGGPLSVKAQAPQAIIADTRIITRAPYRLTASGCGDVIAKLTAVKDWKLAHDVKREYYGEYAANLALMSAKLVIKNASLIRSGAEEGIRILIEALISCGVATSIAGSTRPCSGSEHLFSHALDKVAPKPALHGEQCGVGTIMMSYLHKMDWERIRYSLRILGAPTNNEELGISEEHIIKALKQAHKIRKNRYTILGKKGLSSDDAKKLARSTEVI